MRTLHMLVILAGMLLLFGATGLTQAQGANAEKYPPGLVVLGVTKGSLAEQAGLKQGDVLLSLDGIAIRFQSQIISIRDKARWDNRQTIAVTIQRGVQNLTIILTVGPLFGFQDRPPLPATALKYYDEANTLPKEQSVAIVAKLRAAAEAAEKESDARAAAWLWDIVYVRTPPGTKEQEEALTSALAFSDQAGDLLLSATILNEWGVAAYNRGNLDVTETYLKRSLAIREKLSPDSLDVATSLNNLGLIAYRRGRLDDAEVYFKRALALRERLAPNSLDISASLNKLGNIAYDRGKLDAAAEYYKRALTIREKLAPDSLDVATSLNNLGNIAQDRGRLDAAEVYHKRALALKEKLVPESLAVVASLNNLGNVYYARGKLDAAAEYYKRALAISEKLAPDSQDVATSLNSLGAIAKAHGNLDMAEEFHKRALAINEKLAPDSPNASASLTNLGNVYYARGNLDMAEKYYKRALAKKQWLNPDSLNVATNFDNLGVIAKDRGELDEAEAYHKRALVIVQKLARHSLYEAASLNNLGLVALARGSYNEAELYFVDALAIRRKLAPNSRDEADNLINLGNVAYNRGNLDAAQEYFQHALAISKSQQYPDSHEIAVALNDLGSVTWRKGKLDEAEAYLKQSLAIEENIAAGSLTLAPILINLGDIAYERQADHEAETYFKRALTIQERVVPDSLEAAQSLNNLGAVAIDHGNSDTAKDYSTRALVIREKLAPNSQLVAESLANIGHIAYYQGNLDLAEKQFQRAWRIVLQQGRQVAGDSGRQEFGKANAFYSADLLSIQLQRGKPEAAFATLEEGRSQALLQAMSERGLSCEFVPPDVWKAYEKAEMAHNIAFKDAERALDAVETAKTQLRNKQERDADEAIQKDMQRAVDEATKAYQAKYSEEVRTRTIMEMCLANVRRAVKTTIAPPIDPNQLRKSLQPGTLFLEFAAGKTDLTLFAVTSTGVQSYVFLAKRRELEKWLNLVRRFVAHDIAESRSELVQETDSGTDDLRTLFQKLFPVKVRKAIQQAKHIVISPDEFLWDVPFAALITNSSGEPTYLGLQKPLSYAQSLTVYCKSSSASTSCGTGALIIGNPAYSDKRRKEILASMQAKPTAQKQKPPIKITLNSSGTARRSGELGSMTRNGRAPEQLPYAEEEARQIADLYHTTAHTGIEPTEAWFRQHAERARILHLATHGFFNPFAPQSSGVLFAIPAKMPPYGKYDNDGALQAWEVWSLKVKADLVILSACETGRGATVNGEGMIGLTRAWQYAGAQTIVSSEWKVNDASTAALMVAFHKHLLAGSERDEALRLAMKEIANDKSGRWSSPYHWAAFVMVGQTGKMP